MPEQPSFRLPFPIQGMDRYAAYVDQPPTTSPSLLNVRAFDPIEGRARGGLRPGLRSLYAVSESMPWRMLSQVSRVRAANAYDGTDEDNFDAATEDDDNLGSSWLMIDGSDADLSQKWFDQTYGRGAYAPKKGYGCYNWRKDLVFDTTGGNVYTIQVQAILQGKSIDDDVHLLCRFTDALDVSDWTGGLALGVDVRIAFTWNGTALAYTATLLDFDPAYPGNVTETALGSGTLAVGIVSPIIWVKVDADDVYVTLDYGGSSPVNWGPIGVSGTHAGQKVGIGVARDGDDTMYLDNWLATGIQETGYALPRETRLVTSIAGKLYVEADQTSNTKTPGTLANMATLPGTGVAANMLNRTERMMAAEMSGRLYIADFGVPPYIKTNALIAATNQFQDALVNFTTLNINANVHVVRVINEVANTTPTPGVYRITTVAANAITVSGSWGVAAGTLNVRIEKSPRYYDPATNTVSQWLQSTGLGQIPLGCRICTLHRGRMVLANNATGKHEIFMAADGDPTDWDYGRGDALSAVNLQETTGGTLGEEVTAVIPWTSDYMLMSGTNSLWVLIGNPADGGEVRNITHNVGILDRFAWCYGPAGDVFFMARDGVYRIGVNEVQGYPGQGSNLSRARLPNEMSGWDPSTHEISMAWDPDRQGVFIFACPISVGEARAYFLDARTGGFFADAYPTGCGPAMAYFYNADESFYRRLYLGGRTGVLRVFDTTVGTDSGTPVTSYVQYAPFRPGGNDAFDGIVDYIQAVLPEDTGALQWELRRGETAERAANGRGPVGRWPYGGLTRQQLVRTRAGAVSLRLAPDVAGTRWGVETVFIKARPSGKTRKV